MKSTISILSSKNTIAGNIKNFKVLEDYYKPTRKTMTEIQKILKQKKPTTADELQEQLIFILKRFQEFKDTEQYVTVNQYLGKAINEIHAIRLSEVKGNTDE